MLQEKLLEYLKPVIDGWTEEDIYVISLYVNDEDDNPCQPTVTLGYNTEANYEEERDNASDDEEARWNYAFWLQNEELVFGIGDTEEIIREWMEENGFPYYSWDELREREEAEEDDEEDNLEEITSAFIAELVEAVQELQESGFIEEKFGRAIPVLIHELEYYDMIAEQNIEANGEELVEEFVNFIENM